MTSEKLICELADSITIDEALSDAADLLGPEPLTILASTPRSYVIACSDAPSPDRPDLDACYELRAFNEAGELRWRLPTGSEAGRAEIIRTTSDGASPAEFSDDTAERWREHNERDLIGEIPSSHVLWGNVDEVVQGQLTLVEDRVRSFKIPAADSIEQGHRVQLTGRELVVAGVDGNAFVAAECLVRFERCEEVVNARD